MTGALYHRSPHETFDPYSVHSVHALLRVNWKQCFRERDRGPAWFLKGVPPWDLNSVVAKSGLCI